MPQFKKDRALLAFAALLVLVTAGLVVHGDVTWKEGAAFVTGALALPGLFGRNKDDDDKKGPPAGGSMPLVVVGLLAMLVGGCSPATRAAARGAIVTTAQAVKVGDEACAKYAIERADLPLAQSCESAYDTARASLLVASDGVDAWDEGKRGAVTCAVVHAAEKLARVAKEFRARKIAVPAIVDDGLRLVSLLGGCNE